MATLIAYADGNLTGSTTFKGAETGSSALALIRNSGPTALSVNSSVSTPVFTITNGDVIEGVLLWLYASSATVNGTFLVELQKSSVTQASVTVNCADLPHSATGTNDVTNPVPVFFKFTATATGDGANTWTIKGTASNNTGSQISYYKNSATSGDFTRALRTSATATPAAADDLYIVGELTGAGTHNSRAVTMDSTATTQYGNGTVNSTSANGGGVRISSYGTLSYGTSASTNYVLRVKGDVEIYWNGTLNIGSSGSEIPRTSTAVLEFVMNSATGDFGLQIHHGAFNSAGLSRTSGKNITKTKLTTADVTGASTGSVTGASNATATSSIVDFSGSLLLATGFTDTITNTNHTYVIGHNGGSITNVTQTVQVFLARGSGTNNRFVRLAVGNNSTFSGITNGFFVDIDLQAGTVGTVTATGNGTATSASIVACGTGFVVTMTGKCSSAAATPSAFLVSCSASTTVSYAGDATQCFIFEGFVMVTASSIAATTFNVVDDTGWLSGDVVCVAATSQTAADSEPFNLSANAGASSFTSNLYPFGVGGTTTAILGTHSSNSSIPAEIGLLTRNVKIRSTSTTLWTYVWAEAPAILSIAWTEFYYMGSNTTNKHGVEIKDGLSGSVGAKSITYCSMHDMYTTLYGNTNNSNTSINLTHSNNVGFNCSIFVNIVTATAADYTFDNNLWMKSLGSNNIVTTSDLSGTWTNNTGVSPGALGMQWAVSAANSFAQVGTFSDNTFHSGGGMSLTGSSAPQGTLTNLKCYRTGGNGLLLNTIATDDLIISNPTMFGNPTNISNNLSNAVRVIGGTLCGDTSFATTSNFAHSNSNSLTRYDVQGVDMSGVGGIYAPATRDMFFSPSVVSIQGFFNSCKFGQANPLSATGKTNWMDSSFLGLERFNQTAGDHRFDTRYGQLKTDTSFFNAASPSMRMTPTSASKKLESAARGLGWKVPVSSGNTAAISVFIYKSKTGDGAAYNGNQPRLIQRANPALGQSSNVVLATYSASTGSWNQLSANTSTATDDGAWEIIVDCDGTAGWINVDDLQVA